VGALDSTEKTTKKRMEETKTHKSIHTRGVKKFGKFADRYVKDSDEAYIDDNEGEEYEELTPNHKSSKGGTKRNLKQEVDADANVSKAKKDKRAKCTSPTLAVCDSQLTGIII